MRLLSPRSPGADVRCALSAVLVWPRVRSRAAAASRCARANAQQARCNQHIPDATERELGNSCANLGVPMDTRRRALKRYRRSVYEASTYFAVTSASSHFSAALPAAAICVSCKPALLCSDGCGAAAVHDVNRQPRPTDFPPNLLMGQGHTKKARALARVHDSFQRAHQVAARIDLRPTTCNMQHATCTMHHATCGMQRLTRDIQIPAIPCVGGDARPMPCSAQPPQRGAARWMRGSYNMPPCNRLHATCDT